MVAQLADREDFIVELGLFTLPDWRGHAMWYLFECPECLTLSRDYLHGYRLYLACKECGTRWSVNQKRFYDTNGMTPPPSEWQQFRELWRRRKEYRAPATAAKEEVPAELPVGAGQIPEGPVPDEIKRADENWNPLGSRGEGP